MLFTQIPQQYAPLGGELRYAVRQETAGNIDVRIIDAEAGTTAGSGTAQPNGSADSTDMDRAAGADRAADTAGPVGTSGTNSESGGAGSVGPDRTVGMSGGAGSVGPDRTVDTSSGAGTVGPDRTVGTNGGASSVGPDRTVDTSSGAGTAGTISSDNSAITVDTDRTVDTSGGADRANTDGPVGDGCTLLGAKRFAAVTEAAFDAAPYLRRRLHFTPATGRTGFFSAKGRSVTVILEAGETDRVAAAAVAPARTFLSGDAPGTPGLRTSMPLARLIPEGASDELTLLTGGPGTVTVTAVAGDTATAESYRMSGAGLHLFRLDTRDFPGAEHVRVDAGECGAVDYSVIPAMRDGIRLAWRSNAGSIEHYTFPLVRRTTVRTERREAEGPEGRVVAASSADREVELESAYEVPAVLDALAGLTAAPEVWIAQEEGYTPVDVVTDEAVVRRHGTLCCLEITIRPKRKSRMSWN